MDVTTARFWEQTKTILINAAEGGDIALSDSTKLDIPSNALAKDTEIMISKITNEQSGD